MQIKAEHIDLPVKAFALFAVVLTSAGFLVVSLHDGEYGFSPANPFRPHMLAAGFLFLLFGTLATAIAYTTLFLVGRFGLFAATSKWDVCLVSVPLLFSGLSVVRLLIQPLVATRLQAPFGSFFAWQLTLWGSLISFWTIFLSAGSTRTARAAVRVFSGLSAVLLLIEIAIVHSFPDDFMVTGWLVVSSVVAYLIIFYKRLRTEAFSPGTKYSAALLSLPLALFAVALFALFPYPHIGAKWGGGKPVRVTLTMSKDAPRPGSSIKVVLIEETDSGLYVADAEDSPARFVPRTLISMIEYTPQAYYRYPKNTLGKADVFDLYH